MAVIALLILVIYHELTTAFLSGSSQCRPIIRSFIVHVAIFSIDRR